MIGGAILTLVALAATLLASRYHLGGLAGPAKMAASCGFLWVAVAAGAFASPFGRILFLGLCCSWWGDLFLIGSGQRVFLAGLISFFLGHCAYGVAYAFYQVAPAKSLLALVIMVPHTIVLYRWLMPHVEGPMRTPVLAYMIVISLMVALAAGAHGKPGWSLILLGAALFYVSDIFVARARFVAPGAINSLVGLPLYYAGQVVLAYSISRIAPE